MTVQQSDALKDLRGLFGDRCRQHGGPDGHVATVLPLHAHEVRQLAQVASRHGLPLAPVGGGTAPATASSGWWGVAVRVRFDLMSGVHLPDDDVSWIEAEAGAPWLKLDRELRRRNRTLAVYPTSAPRATVGGWLATDGFGVGSFEFGRLRENVVSASVVVGAGELREVVGVDELGSHLGPPGEPGLVVDARLKTRRASDDRPFAVAFRDPEDLAGAVGDLARAPLWHLAFLSPAMAAARGLRTSHLLFGVIPGERDDRGWHAQLSRLLRERRGTRLDPLEARRVWGERYFPVTPNRRVPGVAQEFVPVSDLSRTLRNGRPDDALQGIVSRSGEVMILTLDGGRSRRAR